MIYKFKSKASGDLIMLGPQGDQLLRLIGREPAAKGIIETGHIPGVLAALQAAIASSELAAAGDADQAPVPAVTLRQRLWPVIEMLRRCQAADKPVVWGV